METMNIYAVSDSVGETAELVAQAVSKQFDIVDFEINQLCIQSVFSTSGNHYFKFRSIIEITF